MKKNKIIFFQIVLIFLALPSLANDKPKIEEIEYLSKKAAASYGMPSKKTTRNESGRYQISGSYIVDTKTGIVKKFENQLGIPFDNMRDK